MVNTLLTSEQFIVILVVGQVLLIPVLGLIWMGIRNESAILNRQIRIYKDEKQNVRHMKQYKSHTNKRDK